MLWIRCLHLIKVFIVPPSISVEFCHSYRSTYIAIHQFQVGALKCKSNPNILQRKYLTDIKSFWPSYHILVVHKSTRPCWKTKSERGLHGMGYCTCFPWSCIDWVSVIIPVQRNTTTVLWIVALKLLFSLGYFKLQQQSLHCHLRYFWLLNVVWHIIFKFMAEEQHSHCI